MAAAIGMCAGLWAPATCLAASFDAAFGSGVREAAQALRPFLKRSAVEPAHGEGSVRQPLARFGNHKG